MRIALGSDERSHLTDFVEQELRRRGLEVSLLGPLAGEPLPWPDVAQAVAEAVAARAWNQANVLCLSLRSTSQVVAGEILDAWFSTSTDPTEAENANRLKNLDEQYRSAAGGSR